MYAKIGWTRAGVFIQAGSEKIFFELGQGKTLGEGDASFAVWALLPLAMMNGEDLYIDADVDEAVLENAMELSRIWAMWVPERFSAINIKSKTSGARTPQNTTKDIQLFSGGVDSTYTLLIERPAQVLSVHGLDYSYKKAEFYDLIAKTDPVLSLVEAERFIVSTNIHDFAHPADIIHGFVLASCLFLFQGVARGGVIAADYTHAQDMVSFPWGTNHVTNAYFSGSAFRMRTAASDKSRIEKLAYLANHPAACAGLSFCGDKRRRPSNCGVCAKCVRTKAMFLAATGTIPPIFSTQDLTAEQIRSVDLSKRKDYAFFADIYGWALREDRLAMIPGLETVMDCYKCRLKTERKRQKTIRRVKKIFDIRGLLARWR